MDTARGIRSTSRRFEYRRDGLQAGAYIPSKDRRILMEKATFGAGCFWGVEHFFREVPGVIDAVSGYAGGHADNPNYRQVCSGTTNHAEVVEVTFDPTKVSYAALVDLFFKMHDPTTLNRQGPDVGTQYRSAIFTHSPEQERVAKERLEAAKASGHFKRPIVTQIEPAQTFWKAEDYHQRYFAKNGGSCHVSYAEVANQ
jgi:peptide-methionine (S)-S-oxide reductase